MSLLSSIKLYARCLRSRYLMPDIVIPSINEAPIDFLKDRGIRGAAIDVDNTLGKYGATSIHPPLLGGVARLTKNFACCLLSNTNDERRARLEGYFGMPAVQTRIRKPNPEAFLEAARFLQILPENMVMFGDRLLTDIAGAKMVGLYAILVNPINWRSEPLKHSLIRGFEQLIYRVYRE